MIHSFLLPFVIALPQTAIDDVRRVPGLTLRHYQLEGDFDRLFELAPDQTPNHDRVVEVLDLSTADFVDVVAPHLTHGTGWLAVEESGDYVFRLTSDDGSRLRIDAELVVDADGLHGAVGYESDPIQLSAGIHALMVEHFDAGGASSLRLEWRLANQPDFTLVPASALSTEDDPTRVTSPGPKAVIDGRKPGLGLPVRGVHPSYRVEDVGPDDFEPKVGALTILSDGRLAIGTFDPLQRDERELPDIESKPPDRLWALDVASGELTEIATDLYEPSGACVVDEQLYVAHRRAITRLEDADGDGYFETHVDVGSGWEGWNYHQFVFGLVHREGKLYAGLSTTMAPPAWEGMLNNAGPNGPLRGGVLEIDLSSGDTRVIAGGTRTPNGVGVLDDGTLLYLDNQGAWMPASVLAEVIPGRFYGHYNWTRLVPKLAERFPNGGHPSIFCDRPRTPPALWLPQNEVVNSPTQPLPWRGRPTAAGRAPYPGEQVLIGELTAGGIRRVSLERVDGVLQGALFRFSQGIEAGVNRMAFGADDSLYVGCIGAQGNWNWRGTQAGLQRLVPTGNFPFEMSTVRAVPGGFEISFTRPIEGDWLSDVGNYRLQSWTYAPTQDYGGPKVGVVEHEVTNAIADPSGRAVVLLVDGLHEGTCVHFELDPVAVDGEPIWSAEAWYTLNRLARDGSSVGAAAGVGLLPPDGAVSLLHGEASPLMRLEATSERPANLTQDDLLGLARDVRVDASTGDLVSTVGLATGALHLEWRTSGPGTRGMASLGDDLVLPLGGTPGGVWEVRDIDLAALIAETSGTLDAVRRLRLGCESGPDGGHVLYRNVWIASVTSEPQPGEWRNLFAEKEDWVVRGGNATFALDSGVLTGTTAPNTPNTFFTSTEEFGDFESLFEVRVDDELNSGVQIRSEVLGDPDDRGGGLIGMQVEIDPSERGWSAGIYEEAGRGWLHPLHAAPYARRAFRAQAWNRVRVVADGPRIQTWINGVPAADVWDTVRERGRIGFQVHGVGAREDPLQVSWRAVRLRQLSR